MPITQLAEQYLTVSDGGQEFPGGISYLEQLGNQARLRPAA
jgi:hypothetical protein